MYNLEKIYNIDDTSIIRDMVNYKYKNYRYFIYKKQSTDFLYFSNFDFEITDYDLKTKDFNIANIRSIIIIKNRIKTIENTIRIVKMLQNIS